MCLVSYAFNFFFIIQNSKLIFFVFLHYRNKVCNMDEIRVIKCYNLLCWKEAGRWWRLQKDFPFA
ncbi:Protein of unknown function [Gryllus bimaculatus]|nr:Protein of unknown function [Gryllus bimaculatus]